MENATLEKITSATDEYIETTKRLIANRKFGEGIFGFNDTAKNDPCHINYFNFIEKTINEASESGLSSENAEEIAEFLLKAHAETNCNDLAAWMLIVIQKLALQLIPLLSKAKKEDLLAWYCSYVPRLQRLPIQNDIVKALKK